MENSQNKKPNKYVVLTTYLVAVICLLLGLFLPLWGDKGILALQLPDVFNKIANKDAVAKNEFALAYPVNFLGTGKTVDIMAYVALLYVIVTALSLLALIPVGISTKKDTRTASVFMYIIEIATVVVTSVYVMIALQYQVKADADISLLPALSGISKFSYNMVIALGGSLLALIVLSLMNKKGTGVAKLFLFLLSAVGLLALFNFSLTIPKLANIKLAPALFGESTIGTGINDLHLLFEGDFKQVLQALPATKDKAAMTLATIVALIAVLNYFIDVIGLSTNAKKSGYFFNVIRYGLEFAALVCLLITVAVCKYKFGLMLIVLPVAVAAQIIISVLRLLFAIKKPKTEEKNDEEEQPEYVTAPAQFTRPAPAVREPERRYEKRYDRPEPVMHEPERPVENTADRRDSLLSTPLRPFENNNEPIMSTPLNEERSNYEPYPEPVLMKEETHKPKEDKYGFNEPVSEEPVQMEIVDIEPAPAKPAEQPRTEEKPVQYSTPVQPSIPVQPVPVQPSSPVHANVNANDEQPRVYTINTIYGGPVDDFMKKLSNDERIEFAMTFIEKSKGNIGNIPDYVIGGNNRMFFSSVFIYLGRIRGLISDGLLNKMYKELNML